jgi:hypothetical protein
MGQPCLCDLDLKNLNGAACCTPATGIEGRSRLSSSSLVEVETGRVVSEFGCSNR